ncbi:MAG: hypothetical protein ABID61_02520, partial [Candidatus Micrarchaeota archaeon]
MKLKCYDKSLDIAVVLDRKQLLKERPNLFRLSNRIPINSVDRTAYDLLDPRTGLGDKIAVKIGFGAIGRTQVNLRNLTYAATALEVAREIGCNVEFVSGAGISSACGLVRYSEVEEQIRDTFALIKEFSTICFPNVGISFNIPTFLDLDTINRIIEIIEAKYRYARMALDAL